MEIRRQHGETGQTLTEHAGTMMIVATIIAVVASSVGVSAPDLGRMLICKIEAAITSLGGDGGDSSSCGDAPGVDKADGAASPNDSKEPQSCEIGSSTESGDLYIKFDSIKVSPSASFVTKEERYIDPKRPWEGPKTRYTVTATDGAGIGVSLEDGTKGEYMNSGLGADLSADADIELKQGDSWEFSSKEEMDNFINEYNTYNTDRQLMLQDSPMEYINSERSGTLPGISRTPDKTSTSIKMSAEDNVDFGLRSGHEDDDDYFNPNIGFYTKASVGDEFARENDHRKDHEHEHTDTITYSGSLERGANTVFAGLSGEGEYEGAMALAFDKDGRLSEISVTQKTSGTLAGELTNGPLNGTKDTSGSVGAGVSNKRTYITTTTIPVTDKNREVLEEWARIARYGYPHGTPTSGRSGALALPPNILNPSTPVPNDPLQQALYEDASVSYSLYDIDGKEFSLSADVGAGVSAGAGFTYKNESSHLQKQSYLGAPPASGAPRQIKESNMCR